MGGRPHFETEPVCVSLSGLGSRLRAFRRRRPLLRSVPGVLRIDTHPVSCKKSNRASLYPFIESQCRNAEQSTWKMLVLLCQLLGNMSAGHSRHVSRRTCLLGQSKGWSRKRCIPVVSLRLRKRRDSRGDKSREGQQYRKRKGTRKVDVRLSGK